MEVFHFQIPENFFVGDENSSVRTTEHMIYYIAARDIEAAKSVVSQVLGEFIDVSSVFSTQRAYLSDILEKTHAKNIERRSQGNFTDEDQHLRKLMQKASLDLGSIVIDRIVLAISNEGKQLISARIEASEGDRRRVVYLQDERDAFVNLKPETIIRALEAKF